MIKQGRDVTPATSGSGWQGAAWKYEQALKAS